MKETIADEKDEGNESTSMSKPQVAEERPATTSTLENKSTILSDPFLIIDPRPEDAKHTSFMSKEHLRAICPGLYVRLPVVWLPPGACDHIAHAEAGYSEVLSVGSETFDVRVTTNRLHLLGYSAVRVVPKDFVTDFRSAQELSSRGRGRGLAPKSKRPGCPLCGSHVAYQRR